MLTPQECRLKADNCAIAISMARTNEDRLRLMRLAALWRLNALRSHAADAPLAMPHPGEHDWRSCRAAS
jgi:hypothetical protein